METWETRSEQTPPEETSIETPNPESAPAEDAPAPESTESSSSSDVAEPGFLAGTATEQAPGIGGDASHPAPAAIIGEDGQLHVAGEPPIGVAPSLPEADPPASGVTDPEAIEKLNAVTEPGQIDTERPDIGTP